MSNTNMEDIFKDYGNFEREPKNDRWSAIAAELDKDKKRRAFWWWIFGGSAASIAAALFVLNYGTEPNTLKTAKQTSSTIQTEEVTTQNNGRQEVEVIAQTPAKNEESYTKEQPASLHNNSTNLSTQNNSATSSKVKASQASDQASKDQLLVNIQDEHPVHDKIKLRRIVSLNPSINPLEQKGNFPGMLDYPEVSIEPLKEEFNPSWDIGISFSASYSSFTPSEPRNMVSSMGSITPELLSENTKLHKQINKGGYSISQGITFAYRFHKNWSMGAGISLHQTTQILKFNLSEVQDDPLNAPQDMPEGGYSSSSGYLLPFQRLSEGSENTVNNKYYGREIPVFVNYRKELNDRFEILANCGVSYRWVSSGSLFLPDIDNVGVLSLNSPEDYPGIRGTWHARASFGIAYKMNNGFSLQALPQCNFGLGSNVRFDRFVQQKQQEFGIQFKLVKNIRFRQ